MIVIMRPYATEENVSAVINRIEQHGLRAHVSRGEQAILIGAVGEKNRLDAQSIEVMSDVEKIVSVTESFKLANRKWKQTPTIVKVGDVEIGGSDFIIMAGPCAVEDQDQLMQSAWAAKRGGAQFLRGGAYKPRTSPYSFQGLEELGLKYMAAAREETGLYIVCEVTSPNAVDIAINYVDILQIGARNMQNFELLKWVGRTNKPVLLKRGICATIDEWLNAAEYIISEGNPNVVLCERGIRTFETATRNTLDISAVPVVKDKSHLPIIVDPSHGTGVRKYIAPLSKAALAAGADGLIIEVHNNPAKALSDGPQSLNPEEFADLCEELRPLAELMGKKMCGKSV